MDQLSERWSMITLSPPSVTVMASTLISSLFAMASGMASPVLIFKYCTITFLALIFSVGLSFRGPFTSVMPSPGAVCPAMVMSPLLMVRPVSSSSSITPDTSNTTIRGPLAIQAARKEPGPLLFRLVTLMMRPPRPPVAPFPYPVGSNRVPKSLATGADRCWACPDKVKPTAIKSRNKHFFIMINCG